MSSTEIAKGFKKLNPGPLDEWYGPYANTAAACAAIPNSEISGGNLRSGKTVGIITVGGVVDYAWRSGVSDADLKVITDFAPFSKTVEVESNFLKADFVGKNLLDAINGLVAGEAYWNDGTIHTDESVSNYLRTPLLRIKPDKDYTLSGYLEGGFNAFIHFFDINKNFISLYSPNPVTTSVIDVKFNTPVNACYFGMNVRTLRDYDPNSLQIEEGIVATAFEPYITQMTKPVQDLLGKKEPLFKFDYGSGKNLFNPADVQIGKDIVNSEPGAFINDPARNAIEISNILPNEEYSLRLLDQQGYVRINMYSQQGVMLLPSLEVANSDITFNTYPGTDHIRISFYKLSNGFANRVMFQKGQFTGYEPYEALKLTDTKALDSAIKNKSVAFNLFNKSKRTLGSFINAYGDVIGGLSESMHAQTLISVKENQTYTLVGRRANTVFVGPEVDNSPNQNFITIRFEDIDGNKIGYKGFYDTINFFPAYASFPFEFTTPAGCVNIRIASMENGFEQSDSFVLTEGTEVLDYWKQFSVWVAKIMVFLGDSVTYLNKHQPLIAEKLKFNWYNNGVSGSCVSPGYEDSVGDGIHRVSFVQRIEKLADFTPDGVVILGGLNDAAQGVPLGTIADEIHPTFTGGVVDPASIVGATFYGSYKYVVKRALELAPDKKIFLITPHRTNSDAIGSAGYIKGKSFAQAIKDIGEYYSLPVLDMYNNSGINNLNTGTYTVDQVHLNNKGAQRYANMMIPFLNS
jgi:lysophospholipase L1-like esterase